MKTLMEIGPIRKYINRIGGEMTNFRTAVVRTQRQDARYWKDTTTVTFLTETGQIKVHTDDPKNRPTEAETEAIRASILASDLPTTRPIEACPALPPQLASASEADLFHFYSREGMFLMIEQRKVAEDGGKYYLPWTYWSDGEWRNAYPNNYPLWGLPQLKDHSTVFIHEGAKSARSAIEAAKDDSGHPWQKQLANAAHLGWIGGANSVARSDWSEIRKHARLAYIIADNDEEGMTATPKIAKRLNCVTWTLTWPERTFPAGFDMGDPFPDHLTKHGIYCGPSFEELLQPETWLTDLVPDATGKKLVPVIRTHARSLWVWVKGASVFVHRDKPSYVYAEPAFNNMAAPFSHIKNPAYLVQVNQIFRPQSFAYRPDTESRRIIHHGHHAINVYQPSGIKPQKGNPKPFLDFMEYLFPIESERDEMLRWCATLVAKPAIHIGYAIMLSGIQGTGKTTLTNSILAPLVGWHNTSTPDAGQVLGAFNNWSSKKRLVVAVEFTGGFSRNAYNLLKAVITDETIRVNQKFMDEYEIDNFCHVILNTNSDAPLKLEQDCRRWFIPTLPMETWPKEKYVKLHQWLLAGGLQIIAHWAKNHKDYLPAGAHPPMTMNKKILQDESRPESFDEATALGAQLASRIPPTVITTTAIRSWVQKRIPKLYESKRKLRLAALEAEGVHLIPNQHVINGRKERIIANTPAFEAYESFEGGPVQRHNSVIVPALADPYHIMEDSL